MNKWYLLGLFVFLCLPTLSIAVEPTFSVGDYVLMADPDEIVNERIYEKWEYDSKTKLPVKSLGEFIKYQYPTVEIKDKEIVSSNTIKVADNKYRVYSGESFIEKDGKWYGLEYAEMPRDQFIEQTTEFLPMVWIKKAFAENIYSNLDGWTARIVGGGTTLSNLRDGVGTNYNSADTLELYIYSVTGSNLGYLLRDNFSFDLSSIDVGLVESATFNIYPYTKYDSMTCSGLSLTSFTPSSFGNLSSSDYENVGDTKYSDDLSMGSINQYFEFSFNEDGLSALSDEFSFSLRIKNDIDNSNPTWDTSDEQCGYNFRSSEYTGTDYDPYLEITISSSVVSVATTTIMASSTCLTVGSTTNCIYDVSPIVGNISFLLVIIITLLFLVVAGFLFNTLTDKARKPWKR